MRPFRFGLQAPRITDPDEWFAIAGRAEREEYSTLLVPDHVGRLSTFPALMAAAGVTERIRLGTYVLNQDFRPPADLAQEASTVQSLTDGRLELGLGAGWAKHEYVQTGIQFDPGGVRVARFEEYVQVVKGLLAAREPFSFEGRWFQVREYQPLPHLASFLASSGRGSTVNAVRACRFWHIVTGSMCTAHSRPWATNTCGPTVANYG